MRAPELPIVFLIGAIIIVGLLLVFFGIKGSNEWKVFAKEHNCKIVGRIAGSTQTGVGPVMGNSGGIAVIITPVPGKTGYLCDDGVTYWR